MDKLTRSWYDLTFELQIRKKRGNEFQDFFSEIMQVRYPGDFVRARPWGRVGDRKNDGYLKSRRMLFAVYAPNEMTAAKAIKKVEEDFTGALPYWEQYFDTWAFVHNACDGLGPDIISKLMELETNHPHLRVVHWGPEVLQKEVRMLGYDDLARLLGHAPSNNSMRQVGYDELKVVLTAIAERPSISEPDLRLPPPDKLQKNDLSDYVEDLLIAGMRKADRVGRFFAHYHDPLYGDRVVEAFKQKYQSLAGKKISPDQIFTELLTFAGGAQRKDATYEASVLAVLAYLFEACDIFES